MAWGGLYVADGFILISYIGTYGVTTATVISAIAIGGALIYWGYSVFDGKDYKYKRWKFKGKVLNKEEIDFIDE